MQQGVDCCPPPGCGGCYGGKPESAYRYYASYGLALDSDYAYVGAKQACK